MATLLSEETSIPSFLHLQLGPPIRDGGRWIAYSLILESGDKILRLEDRGGEIGRCLFAAAPFDEVERWIQRMERFLGGSEKEFSFEPAEPNFEFLLRREALGFIVFAFIDSGNQYGDHATWDGFGLRMFTTKEHLEDFLAQLKEEHRHAISDGRAER